MGMYELIAEVERALDKTFYDCLCDEERKGMDELCATPGLKLKVMKSCVNMNICFRKSPNIYSVILNPCCKSGKTRFVNVRKQTLRLSAIHVFSS